MTSAEFKELALALREAGAVKVRAGELEVIWPGPFTPSAAAQNGLSKSAIIPPPTFRPSAPPPKNPEEARLREFKAELEGDV